MHSILLVDDDVNFCQLISRYLDIEGFNVTVCNEAKEGFNTAITQEFDLIILDVMLPEISGFDLLKKIRQRSSTPIVMCTALSEDIHEIVGLESGAYHYIKKSAHPRVMLAKINSVLRRRQEDAGVQIKNKTFSCENMEVNTEKRTVHVEGEFIDLTTTEFNILSFLLDFPESPRSKKEISLKVLGKKLSSHDRSIDIHISRLRAKLGNRDNKTARIKTIQGFGYQLNTDD